MPLWGVKLILDEFELFKIPSPVVRYMDDRIMPDPINMGQQDIYLYYRVLFTPAEYADKMVTDFPQNFLFEFLSFMTDNGWNHTRAELTASSDYFEGSVTFLRQMVFEGSGVFQEYIFKLNEILNSGVWRKRDVEKEG